MNVREALALGREILPRRPGLPEPSREAVWLLARVLNVSELRVRVEPEIELNEDQRARFAEWIRRRAAGEPAHHLVGTCPFWGLELRVSPAVLVPRPETELLVQAALDLDVVMSRGSVCGRPLRVLDVGTGSGCILAALGSERPGWSFHGVDRSLAALELARSNLRVAGVEALLWQGDLASAVTGRFDLVVANLPYIPTADLAGLPIEVQHDPVAALDGGDDGLALIERLARDLPGLLGPQGRALLEIGEDQADSLELLASRHGLIIQRRVQDLGGCERVVVLRRRSAEPGV